MGLVETIKGTETINLNETSEKKSIVNFDILFYLHCFVF